MPEGCWWRSRTIPPGPGRRRSLRQGPEGSPGRIRRWHQHRERGNNLTAFETRCKGHSGKEHFQQESVPICFSVNCLQRHIHACAIKTVVPYQECQYGDHCAAQSNSHKGIRQVVLRQMLRFVEYIAHCNAQQGYQNSQNCNSPDTSQIYCHGSFQREHLCVNPQHSGNTAGYIGRKITGQQGRSKDRTDGFKLHAKERCRQGRSEETRKNRTHAAHDQNRQFILFQFQTLSQDGCHRSAQLKCRTLTAGTAAEQMGDGTGQKITGAISGLTGLLSKMASMISFVPRLLCIRHKRYIPTLSKPPAGSK